jgi:hypothetical protein
MARLRLERPPGIPAGRTGHRPASRSAQCAMPEPRGTRLAALAMLGGSGILWTTTWSGTWPTWAIYTSEGTETMQALIVGRDITGLSAIA